MIKLDHWNWFKRMQCLTTQIIFNKRFPTVTISSKNIEDTSKKVNIPITVNNVSVNTLADTGSTLGIISDQLRRKLNLQNLQESECCVSLNVKGHQSQSLGTSKVNLKVKGSAYEGVTFTVLQNLVSDVNLGQNFINLYESVSIQFSGSKPTLDLGALRSVCSTTSVSLFKHLSNL